MDHPPRGSHALAGRGGAEVSAVVIPFVRPLPVPRVEICSPGFTKNGERAYFVDIVDHGGSATMWGGRDIEEAYRAAADCAEGEGEDLPIVDLTNPARGLQ